MIPELLMWIGGIVATGVFGLIGWAMAMILSKFKDHENVHLEFARANKELDKKIDDHRLYAAETFTTKNDIKDMKEEIISHLVRMEVKLDGKQDKK